jgi:hypothetical protein
MTQWFRNDAGEWEAEGDRTDPFGNAAGWDDGTGAVRLGDGVYAPTLDYETIRLPDELGGAWCIVLSSRTMRLPDGRIGRYHVLQHPEIDCISLLNGDGALWVRKPSTQEDEQE